jgi:exopolysaccharide biosynthesis polyprenyl glycosylphosphotransferase
VTSLAGALVQPGRSSRQPGAGAILLTVPTVAGTLVALFTRPGGLALEVAALAVLVFLSTTFLATRPLQHSVSLGFSRAALALTGSVTGAVALAVLTQVLGLPEVQELEMLVIIAATTAIPAAPSGTVRMPGVSKPKARRVAVIGSDLTASSLDAELRHAGVTRFEVVGRIGPPEDRPNAHPSVPDLGRLGGLAGILRAHEIDLVLITGDVPELAIFEELARSCLHLPVRVCQLADFYESVFGHVPIAEINAAWFQYIMHPSFRSGEWRSKRILDIVLALSAGLVFLPLVPIIALLVASDGGPLLFRQARIGQGGRPFTILKFRTMRHAPASDVAWTSARDHRVTRVGRLLRLTHLDELPQLVNVLRADMSMVGPRPEQPAFVDRLERFVPFYQRRHLVRPGITGWAQVRCGYAGSDVGSMWKLCHDLFYLKHRSASFDLIILVETLRMLVRDSHRVPEPRSVPFVLSTQAINVLGAPAAVGEQRYPDGSRLTGKRTGPLPHV